MNDAFLKWMNQKYGSLKEVSATRGKVHRYLGMVIDFSSKGRVKFRMNDYVKEMLNDFPEKMGSKDISLTPASSRLFENNNSKLLDNRKQNSNTRMWLRKTKKSLLNTGFSR